MAAPASAAPRRVALVTGASKGIGLEIVRQLLAVDGLTAVLGCQDMVQGEAAAAELRLREPGCCADVVVQRIELTDPASIARARTFVEAEYGRLDILINNAAIVRTARISCM